MTLGAPATKGASPRAAARGLTAAELFRTTVTAVLLALLVTWMCTAWWSAPRSATVADLDRALAAGDVTSYVRANNFEREGIFVNPSRPDIEARGWYVVWQTASGQTFYVAPDEQLGGPEQVGPPGGSTRPRLPAATAVEEQLRAAGVLPGYDDGDSAPLGTALVLIGLVVLIGGPEPRRGTRWFWFWVGGVPAGLGVLAWLVLERIRPPPQMIIVEGQRDPRWHGPAGLGWLLLGTLLAGFAAWGLRDTFGGFLVPG